MFWLIKFAASAMMPRHESLPGVAETGLDPYVRQFMSETNWLTWIGVFASSVLFMLSPILTLGLPVPALLLTRRALDRHASRLASHRIYLLRQSMFIVKMVAGFCWGANPDVRARFNMAPYTGDPGTWKQA